jgi:acetyltransferase-like isoleucine patch superfamily enzyme
LYRKVILKVATQLEGGRFFSYTLRKILSNRFGVNVGAYSYGPCLVPGAFPSGVSVGRYVSIANGVKILLRNHPISNLSLHPFFYNSGLGYLKKDTIQFGTLEIGHDAWIGENALVTPGCSRIGNGAIVGAGAVVTKDVPDFAIVAGNPAKLIRYRFTPEVITAIHASHWWERTVEEIIPHISSMTVPLSDLQGHHPLLGASFP